MAAQPWLASVAGAVALEAEAGHIDCAVAAEQVDTLMVEPRFMARAAINLLRNAIRHAHGRIAITLLQPDANHYWLVVDDDGPGVPAADRARIFEPFTRLDASRNRATGGFGLGLAIVRRIAEWHHGTVEVVDSPLGGARFIVSWTAAIEAAV